MSNIRQVQWNEGAPEKVQIGMIVSHRLYKDRLIIIGHADAWSPDKNMIYRWAWLIQPHELNWLEDMANRGKVSSRGE